MIDGFINRAYIHSIGLCVLRMLEIWRGNMLHAVPVKRHALLQFMDGRKTRKLIYYKKKIEIGTKPPIVPGYDMLRPMNRFFSPPCVLWLLKLSNWGALLNYVCKWCMYGFNDYFPWFSLPRSVTQEESFRIVGSLSSVSGSGESNHGMHGSQLSQSDSAPPLFSFSNDRGSWSSINTTLQLEPNAAERGVVDYWMFNISAR